VSESAGDLAPGGCALRRNQLRDVSNTRRNPRHPFRAAANLVRDHRPALAHLDLLLPRGLSALLEFRPQHGAKLGERAPIVELQSDQRRNVLVQDAARPLFAIRRTRP